MNHFKSTLVIGASSGVGRALAGALAQHGVQNITVAARDARDLQAVASDLSLRYGAKVHVLTLDLISPQLIRCDEYDSVLIAAGMSMDADDGQTADAGLIDTLTGVNYTGIAKLLSAFFLYFQSIKDPTYIGVCSTIAAPVPRARNMFYAAAKNALESLAKSMQHAAAQSKTKVQIFRLGYVDSSLTYGKKLLFPPLSPALTATAILQASTSSKRLVYVPGYWRYIVIILKLLPWTIYSRLRF